MQAAEHNLLAQGIAWHDTWKTNHSEVPSDQASCHFEASDVPVDGGHIHQARYFAGPRPAEMEGLQRDLEPGTALVFLHGFGAGVGIWYSAMPAIRALWDGPVFVLDWFGCSLSSRPKWELRHGRGADPAEIEHFFIDPLEQWRTITGLERMVVVGHSIGGYLGACYADRFPERVEDLILVSPAGVSGKADMDLPPTTTCAHFMVDLIWNRAGFNPLMLIWYTCRWIGPWPLQKWFSSFRSASWLARELLVEYHYQSTLQGEVSGGHCLTGLLEVSGGHQGARNPLSRRLSSCSSLTFIYGSRDHLFDAGAPGLTTMKKLTGKEPAIIRVAGAGHDMMVDNPMGFAEALMAATSKQPIAKKLFGEEALQREFSAAEL
mmetsp:Transcript_112348/g.194846  ORF Transcript_112348/g.194846 Transcript_112348/m.194846 type:complete len:377 (-) Transcript_112348:156-1286(-)